MRREILRVDGVSDEQKKQLQEAAMQLYGVPNASLLVRWLIDNHLNNNNKNKQVIDIDFNDRVRVVLKLPRAVLDRVDYISENRISDRNYYLVSVILREFNSYQLQGDEIEVLRRSNYEISKIGTNLNQISRALNSILRGSGEPVPEVSKKVASLRREVKDHVSKVLKVLNVGALMFESRNAGRIKQKKKKDL